MAIARSPSVAVDCPDPAALARFYGVIGLGASRHPDQPGTSYRVFLDPAGHPFCLCLE